MTTGSIAMTPDVQNAVKQVRQSFGIARLEDLAVLDINGPDAVRFMQNRLTNDVQALPIGEGQLNAALDRQGKIQGVFGLYRYADGLKMLISKAEQENCIAQIEKFHIVEQFTITEITGVVIISLQGAASAEFLQSQTSTPLPAKEHHWVEAQILGQPAWIIRRSFSGEVGFVLLVQSDEPQVTWDALKTAAFSAQGIEMSPDVQEILRIETGIPRFGTDYDFETLLPETGLERHAVSYSKGCYLGQETIARIKTYGTVQKALVGLLFEPSLPDEEIPPVGCLCIMLDGKEVGMLKSRVFSPTLNRMIAFAYLGKNERVPGKLLSLSIDGKPFSVEVALLPFYEGSANQKSAQELLTEGLKLFSEGFDEAAIRVLRLAIEADPKLLEAYEALGVILSRHEQFEEAIALMNQLLALDPDHVLAHTNLSVFYMKLGDKEKAEEEKAKATMAAFSKRAKESGLVLDLDAERRKKEEATLERIAMFQEALKFSPEDPLGNFGLGSALLELKRFAEAIEPFEKTIKAQPKHSVAYLSLGKSLEGAGDLLKAQNVYQKGIEVAAAKGDLMPLKELQAKLESLTLKLKGEPG